MKRLRHLDLFSGIGGFTLGHDPVGYFVTKAFVEISPFCGKVLKCHWPEIPLYLDIRDVNIERDQFDVLSGGFPCQDVSLAAKGNQRSILGDRSGLWWEYLRLIREGLPQWVEIENVENLRSKGLAVILAQIAELGYDAEWNIIRACDVGLPHIRKRLWILAHHQRHRVEGKSPFPLSWLRGVPWHENIRSLADWTRGLANPPPELCRSLHGIPFGMDRLNAVGNSIVPQIAWHLGMSIREYYEPTTRMVT
jgi:DNA (cytosine-5)-methyltransferase 1